MTVPSPPSVLHGFDPTLLLVLNLAGTFVFGLSGGLAGVQKRLDMFGVVVLAVVVGLAGGVTRDLLIGVAPQTFRDWRYLAVAGGAGLVTLLAHQVLQELERPILVLDAAGLALFCVTGASTALDYRMGAVEAVVLGAITGIGGGVLRDVLLGEIPVVLRTGLYAIPALVGAAIVVVASRGGTHNLVFPLLGALVCFVIRLAGLHFDLNIPQAPSRGLRRSR
ncbi:MAG TPA: TRIC cation channel family protein [Gaiellales bacterium]|nr:TRIC cation channel family protein [Gaiellales bacterium]